MEQQEMPLTIFVVSQWIVNKQYVTTVEAQFIQHDERMLHFVVGGNVIASFPQMNVVSVTKPQIIPDNVDQMLGGQE